MSWRAIPDFILSLAKELQKEQLYEFWVKHYQFIQVPFSEFLEENDNTNKEQLGKEERKKVIEERISKSNWKFEEL